MLTEQESSPDLWFRSTANSSYIAANEAAASFLGALPTNMALVENATTGKLGVIVFSTATN